MMLTWKRLHPKATPEMLGYIPMFLHGNDPRSAKEQLDANYVHGGFQPFHGFTMSADGMRLIYPGDPPMQAIAETKLRDETIRLYEAEWVAVIQPDGSFEVARMD